MIVVAKTLTMVCYGWSGSMKPDGLSGPGKYHKKYTNIKNEYNM
jgi:hypothetical protein